MNKENSTKWQELYKETDVNFVLFSETSQTKEQTT